MHYTVTVLHTKLMELGVSTQRTYVTEDLRVIETLHCEGEYGNFFIRRAMRLDYCSVLWTMGVQVGGQSWTLKTSASSFRPQYFRDCVKDPFWAAALQGGEADGYFYALLNQAKTDEEFFQILAKAYISKIAAYSDTLWLSYVMHLPRTSKIQGYAEKLATIIKSIDAAKELL